jgi:hypothetical protein
VCCGVDPTATLPLVLSVRRVKSSLKLKLGIQVGGIVASSRSGVWPPAAEVGSGRERGEGEAGRDFLAFSGVGARRCSGADRRVGTAACVMALRRGGG